MSSETWRVFEDENFYFVQLVENITLDDRVTLNFFAKWLRL